MKKDEELDVMRIIGEHLSTLQDQGAKNRVLRWAWEKFSTQVLPSEEGSDKKKKSKNPIKKKTTPKKARQKRKNKSGPSLVRDLNLRPSKGKTLDQFIQEKMPNSNQEKCLVSTYYLIQHLKKKADVDSIYTCFKHSKWRVPSNIENTLCVVAVQKGWLDTTDLADIKIPTLGENYVEHDLPKATKTKGKK